MTTATEVKPQDYAHIEDVDEATWAYLKALKASELRAQLFPYARHRMVCLKREAVRELEDEVFGETEPAAERLPVNLLANREKLLKRTFTLPTSGERVEWLLATPAQHRERAEWQRKLAGKCLVDAERHEEAARVIEEFNVSCLMEIES